MAEFPYAWIFFIVFILCTSFTVLNLFIGIIVSAMQAEHENEAIADRDILHQEQAAILEQLQLIREHLESRNGSGPGPDSASRNK